VSTMRHPLMDDCLDVVRPSGSRLVVAVARAQMPRGTYSAELRRVGGGPLPSQWRHWLTPTAADESRLTSRPPVSTIIFFLDDIAP